MRYLLPTALLLLPAIAAAAERPGQPAAGTANYGRPFEPPTRPAFLELPPGSVEPGGWLRDWCLAARDGYTGSMDAYDPAFRQAWAADYTMTGERLNWPKGGWPYEGGGYWFDGLARLGFALHDEGLLRQAKERLDVVVNHMHTNGILFLWWLDKNNPEDVKGSGVDHAWPIWASGLLGRAMAGYYFGSQDKRVLDALEAAYGDGRDWLRTAWGMSNPWPAFDSYTWTGNKQIAAALTSLFAEGGGGKDPGGASWNRYRRPPDAAAGIENDHVVHFLESTTPWALGYLWTGRREFLEAALAWHEFLGSVAMQPHGAPVADEWYGPTGAFRGTETCDVAGYVWSQAALLAVSGEGRLADRLERAFFNAGPATVSRDFRTHVYFQSPNRVAVGSPDFPHGPRAKGGSYHRTHAPLCCTAALNRIIPNYVTHMWMATYDNGLAATCYGPCAVKALAADRVPVEITCKTAYPFDETIEMSVNPSRAAAFPLRFRMPGWCANPRIEVNGVAVKIEPDGRGFARIERTWQAGDVVRLRFPMRATVETGRDSNREVRRDGAHRASRVAMPEGGSTNGAPYATVAYGPLLFALPIHETKDANTPDPSAKWNYALDAQQTDIAVERRAMPARWDWPIDSPLVLRANAVPVAWNPAPGAPCLPEGPISALGPPERIALVPYGCTKFRVSMFPSAAEPAAFRKVLFLGNSITWHGPKQDIGWTGSWGMAASAEDRDYAHLVVRGLGAAPESMIKNIAEFERQYATYDPGAKLKDAIGFGADLIILAVGENVPALDSEEAKAAFGGSVRKLIGALKAGGHPRIVVRSCFWPNAAKDAILRQVCQAEGGIFVDIGALAKDEANFARSERAFEHKGVAAHPGDRGMQAIAGAILEGIKIDQGRKTNK